MADVVVTVMIDGKQAFVHGAAGALDAHASVVGGLQVALRHFQDILASRYPAPTQQNLAGAGQLISQHAGTKPQDTSL